MSQYGGVSAPFPIAPARDYMRAHRPSHVDHSHVHRDRLLDTAAGTAAEDTAVGDTAAGVAGMAADMVVPLRAMVLVLAAPAASRPLLLVRLQARILSAFILNCLCLVRANRGCMRVGFGAGSRPSILTDLVTSPWWNFVSGTPSSSRTLL